MNHVVIALDQTISIAARAEGIRRLGIVAQHGSVSSTGSGTYVVTKKNFNHPQLPSGRHCRWSHVVFAKDEWIIRVAKFVIGWIFILQGRSRI